MEQLKINRPSGPDVEAPDSYMFALTPQGSEVHLVSESDPAESFSACGIRPHNGVRFGWGVVSRNRAGAAKVCRKCVKVVERERNCG